MLRFVAHIMKSRHKIYSDNDGREIFVVVIINIFIVQSIIIIVASITIIINVIFNYLTN